MTPTRRRILGIDPGSRRTGYGIIDVRGNAMTPVAWGVIRTEVSGSFPDRLHLIHRELTEVILRHRPTDAAVENVFLAKNAASALKLGQARGAAIVTCRANGIPVHEYSAKEIKTAATGYGAASKEQVAGMVRRLLGIREEIPADASDALAMAFCRAVTRDIVRQRRSIKPIRLIIGDEDLLVGTDDPRYYRMRAAAHMQGRDHVRLATEYFYSLRNDPRIRVLKTETAVEWNEIESLRGRIRAESEIREQAG